MPIRQIALRMLLAAPVGAAALMSAAGCQNDAPVAARADDYEIPWLMTTPAVRADTRVGDARQFYDEFNLLHVTVPVRNVKDRNVPLSYKFTFYDRNGAEVSAYTGQTVLPPRGQVELSANATNARATGPAPFRLEMRYLERPY